MIKLKHKAGFINVPQLWTDVKWHQYQKAKGETNVDFIISALTGLELSDVKRIDDKSKSLIVSSIIFVQRPLIIDQLICPEHIELNGKKVKSNIDIMERTFYQKIQLQELLSNKDFNIEQECINIIELYLQDQISGNKYDPNLTDISREDISKEIGLVDAYAIAFDLVNKMKKQVEIESVVLKSNYTSEQIRAGISNFDQYKYMNIVKALAGGDILKYNDVLMLEYNTVFLHMRMNKTEAEFQKAYQKIISKK